MNPLLKKLNFKSSPEILVWHAPESLTAVVGAFSEDTVCVSDLENVKQIEFALFFVFTQEEVNAVVEKIAGKLVGDCVLWFCYPKKSSKKYTCEIDRDHGWQVLGDLGFEPVRMVAIDEDFSALRFRQVDHIKTITRNSDMALTEKAKQRTTHTKKKT